MASLSAHVREEGDHGRLGFHPSCPVCCSDRLAGRVPSDGIVTVRTKALLAAGVLAVSSVSPASVLAASGDQEGAGTADPANVTGGDLSDPEGSAGASDDGAVDPNSAAPEPDDDSGPVGPDLAEQADPGSGGAAEPTATATPAPVAAAPVAAKPVKPSGGAAPATGPGGSAPATAPAPAAPVPDGSTAATAPAAPVAPVAGKPQAPVSRHGVPEEAAVRGAAAAVHAAESRRVRQRPLVRGTQLRVVVAVPQQAAHAAPVRQASVARPVAAADVERARAGVRAHVVIAGESLWSIASDVLGGRATVARVAREVNRLWDLNGARIGTGDRDLLPVGTRLELQ